MIVPIAFRPVHNQLGYLDNSNNLAVFRTLLFTFRALYLKKKLNVNLKYLYLSHYQIIARFWLMIYTFACIGASKTKFVESRQESHNCATSAKFK